jgi:hypothetical protein
MIAAVQPRKGGFCIGVTCPGCGGELDLADDFFVLTCSHCGSVLRIVMPEAPPAYLVARKRTKMEIRPLVDRYCKENGLPLTGSYFQTQSLLYPYWKIEAVTLKVRHTVYEADVNPDDENFESTETEEKEFTSITLAPFSASCAAGVPMLEVPATLGARAEYIRMLPMADKKIGADETCVGVRIPLAQGLQQLSNGLIRLGKQDGTSAKQNSTDLLHAKGSLVFFPYFVVDAQANGKLVRFVVDGVTGRVSGHSWLNENAEAAPEFASESDESAPSVKFGALGVVLHRCPNCGVDLPATQSFVYQCHNCDRIFFLEDNRLLKRELQQVAGTVGPNDNLVPFWSFRLPEGASQQLQRLFGGIYRSDFLLVPGFKMRNLEAMYRLCKRMSSMAPKLTLSICEKLAPKQLPVTISAEEASTMVELIWRREVVGRDMKRDANSPAFSPTEIALVYAPFHAEDYFFVDSVSGAVTFERGSLA